MRRIFAALAVGGAIALAMPIAVPAHAEGGRTVIRVADRDHDHDRDAHRRHHKIVVIKHHRGHDHDHDHD